MTNNYKTQKRRESPVPTEKPPVAALRTFSFTDGKKIKAKNYADALRKRNKMMGSPPMSKSIDDNTE